jgi:hypothetical protein
MKYDSIRKSIQNLTKHSSGIALVLAIAFVIVVVLALLALQGVLLIWALQMMGLAIQVTAKSVFGALIILILLGGFSGSSSSKE